MANQTTILTVENLGVKFGEHEVLKDLNFFVQNGDTLAIVGPNGSGKSVLFRALMGLVPHSGKMKWADGLKINYVPQKFFVDAELPLSVGEFMGFKTKSRSKIIEALKAVGLTENHDEHHIVHHILNRRLGWLSGGQMQRVLIAWAILDNPDVLLFDEPTSGVDVGGEETIYNLLRKIKEARSLTIILISHDLNIVYKYANNVICLNKKMICYGQPHDVLDPAALTKLYGGETAFYKHEHEH